MKILGKDCGCGARREWLKGQFGKIKAKGHSGMVAMGKYLFKHDANGNLIERKDREDNG